MTTKIDSLYAVLLKSTYKNLPEEMRRFHDEANCTRQGAFVFTYGNRLIGFVLTRVLGWPRQNEEVPLALTIETKGKIQWWIRNFDGHVLKTAQEISDGLLKEGLGPMRLYFKLVGVDNGYDFLWQHTKFLGIKLPRILSPKITATVRGGEKKHWQAEIVIDMPLMPGAIQYSGRVFY